MKHQLLLNATRRNILAKWLEDRMYGKNQFPDGFRRYRFNAFQRGANASINLKEISSMVVFFRDDSIYAELGLGIRSERFSDGD